MNLSDYAWLAIAAGFAAGCLRYVRSIVFLALRRRTINVYVDGTDPARVDLCRRLLARGKRFGGNCCTLHFAWIPNEEVPKLNLMVGPGRHIAKIDGVWCYADFTIKEGTAHVAEYTSADLTFWTSDRQKVHQLLQDAANEFYRRDEGVEIYRDDGGCWESNVTRRGRPLESVICAAGVLEALLEDLTWFLEAEDWYVSRGIPYRRNYQLYGPPGNGKSSVIEAIAKKLNLRLCVLSLNSPGLFDSTLVRLVHSAPSRSIIVLEDVDCCRSARRRAEVADQTDARTTDRDEDARSVPGCTVTLSGLLNVLDGPLSPEPQIVFMTTNHPERLDPALTRPGRTDLKILFGNATTEQAARLYRRFFPDSDRATVERFAAKWGDGRHCMASIQEELKRRSKPQRTLGYSTAPQCVS